MTSSNTEYIQVDLGKMVTLKGVATQGVNTMKKWVKSYSLKYSIDGSQWHDYKGNLASSEVTIISWQAICFTASILSMFIEP